MNFKSLSLPHVISETMRLSILIILCFILANCQDETRENPPLKGYQISVPNSWQFYFVNEEGKSAINLNPGAVLPTTDLDRTTGFQQEFVPDHFDETAHDHFYLYNGNHNSIGYDEEKGLYYWKTTIPGYEYSTQNEFYVHFNQTDTDTLRAKFKFISEGVIGGDKIPQVTELYYNGKLIIKNGNYSSPEGIIIKK